VQREPSVSLRHTLSEAQNGCEERGPRGGQASRQPHEPLSLADQRVRIQKDPRLCAIV